MKFNTYASYGRIQPLIARRLQFPISQQTTLANRARSNMLMGSIPVQGATYYSRGYTIPAQVFRSPNVINQKGAPSSTSSGVFSFPSTRFSGAQGAIIAYLPPRMPGSL
jgi:hypothetical protein